MKNLTQSSCLVLMLVAFLAILKVSDCASAPVLLCLVGKSESAHFRTIQSALDYCGEGTAVTRIKLLLTDNDDVYLPEFDSNEYRPDIDTDAEWIKSMMAASSKQVESSANEFPSTTSRPDVIWKQQRQRLYEMNPYRIPARLDGVEFINIHYNRQPTVAGYFEFEAEDQDTSVEFYHVTLDGEGVPHLIAGTVRRFVMVGCIVKGYTGTPIVTVRHVDSEDQLVVVENSITTDPTQKMIIA